MKNLIIYIILLLVCILTRMMSSLNYIEDLESLNFTFCILDHSIMNCKGSMAFAFLVKSVFFLIPDLPLAFSIIGGLSVFLMIIFALRIVNAPLFSLEGGLTAILIFFNPLVWITSNRYSPDLLGAALLMAAIYLFLADTKNVKNQAAAWFLFGLLAGVKLLFVIPLVIPALYCLSGGRKYLSLAGLPLGLALWLLPALAHQMHTNDLFAYNVVFQTDLFNHLYEIIKSIWANGLGGYWPGRNLFLILTSLALVICLFFGSLILLDYGLNKYKLRALNLGFLSYVLILAFSDLSPEFNPLLPLIPFICILIAYGIIYFIVNFNHSFIKIGIAAFLLINIGLSIVGIVDHKQLSALAQAKAYLEEKQDGGNKLLIISEPNLAAYMARDIKADYFSSLPVNPPRFVLIGIGSPVAGRKVKNHIVFQHDPFINKHYPMVEVYEY